MVLRSLEKVFSLGDFKALRKESSIGFGILPIEKLR